MFRHHTREAPMDNQFVRSIFPSVVLATAAIASTSAKAATSCEDLATIQLPDTTIVSAVAIPPGPFASLPGVTTTTPTCSSDVKAVNLPAFCRVTANVATPSAPEPIRFELWLPLSAWNGRFQGY